MSLHLKFLKIQVVFIACFAVAMFLMPHQSYAATEDPTFGGFLNTSAGTATINPSQYATEYKGNMTRVTTVQEGFGAIINFIVSFMGFAAMIMLMYGGFTYITANGEQSKVEKGKKIVWQAIVAMLIIFGVYAAVNTALNVSSVLNSNFRVPLGPLDLQSGAGGTTLQLPL